MKVGNVGNGDYKYECTIYWFHIDYLQTVETFILFYLSALSIFNFIVFYYK